MSARASSLDVEVSSSCCSIEYLSHFAVVIVVDRRGCCWIVVPGIPNSIIIGPIVLVLWRSVATGTRATGFVRCFVSQFVVGSLDGQDE